MPNCIDRKCACNPIINEQSIINMLYRHLPIEGKNSGLLCTII